ncbi:hypothetical protein BSK66_31735 [Paenibacillus odorifer]|uniref:hypothetical protein n=1 Tax=Paenibacillus TaxID=44249 RepID=UPI0003E20F8F|nr:MULTISPECIES: hypothetical protein [Paenibacillus]ETT46243.1 hypothetical protein C171_28347 [Paenibacillus sp. FSL H8-237]OME46665.1 hypothetical protein BSK66_31735 [Paenibacillus odorifer]
MKVKLEQIRYHREQIWYWTKALQHAKGARDEYMEQQALRERRNHTMMLNDLWASPAEQLAVCI